jgi:predicted RNase H-like nuclease (RuvC/YqgF family)
LDLTVISPIVIAAIAPLGAYLLAAHRMSGRVDTSTASELWGEARSIRDDYNVQLKRANERVRDLESRVEKCEGQNYDLVRENYQLKAKVRELERLIGGQ